jgi:hypothetical protein
VLAPLLALCLTQAAPEAATAVWTLELSGTPTAIARARLEGGRFTWFVETPFARGANPEVVVKVNAEGRDSKGRVPEGLWFMRRPQPGCVKGFDEVSGREGELCFEPDGRGTALGEKFSGSWGDDGVLETLFIRGIEWKRGASAWTGKNPWAAGFAVKGEEGALAVEGAARFWVQSVTPRPTGKRKSKGDCMTVARAAIDAAPRKLQLVLGLAVEGDRVWPHAWTRQISSREHEDPSVPVGEVADRVYIELPIALASRVYLDLLSGNASVVRK